MYYRVNSCNWFDVPHLFFHSVRGFALKDIAAMLKHLRPYFHFSSQGSSNVLLRLSLPSGRSSSALAMQCPNSHNLHLLNCQPKKIVSLLRRYTFHESCDFVHRKNLLATEFRVSPFHRMFALFVSRGYNTKSENESACQENVLEHELYTQSEQMTFLQSSSDDHEKDAAPQYVLDDETEESECRASRVNDVFHQGKFSQVDLEKFLERTEHIVRILSLLREWNNYTLDALVKLKITYDTAIVTQVLRSLGDLERDSIDAAVGFFNWLRSQESFKHDEYTYGVMLNALGKAGRIEEMQALYEEMRGEGRPLTVVTRCKIMFWLGRAHKLDEVVRHWEQMEEEAVKPTVSTYTIMIDSLARAKHYRKVADIYKDMLKKECLPNARTHTVLIEHLIDAGKLDSAFNILGIMENMKVVPNKVTYETLIIAYVKTRNIEMVIKLVAAMKERFLRPGIRLAVAVRDLQDAGRLEEASVLAKDIWPELYQECRTADEALVSVEKEFAYTNDNEVDHEADVWRADGGLNAGLDLNAFALALKNWNPSVLGHADIRWSSLLVYQILRRVRDRDAAWALFNFLRGKAGFKHDSYSCMLMMQRILREKSNPLLKARLMEELLVETRQEGSLCVPMINMVIRYHVGLGNIDEALKMFDSIRELGLEPNEASYTAMIIGLARDRQGRKAMGLFEEMQQNDMKPTSQVYTELIKCLGLAGKYESAHSLFRKVVRSGAKPGGDVYMAIISMYNRLGNQKMALYLYEKMRAAGIRPAQVAGFYEIVKAVLRRANRVTDLQALAKRRRSFNLFQGSNKRLQESLLSVISIFSTNFVEKRTQPVFIDNV